MPEHIHILRKDGEVVRVEIERPQDFAGASIYCDGEFLGIVPETIREVVYEKELER